MPKKGYKQSKEHIRKAANARKGFKHSPETRRKMSERQLGEKNHFYGKHFSEEHKRKISEAGKERRHSEESKRKMSEAARGRIFSVLHRKRIGEKSKGRIMGSKNPRWNNGIKRHPKGYLLIRKPSHPFCTKEGYIWIHRLVIEKQIKRFLKPGEACHHINKIRNDNRPENLMAFKNNSSHTKFENGNPINPSDIIFDGRKL